MQCVYFVITVALPPRVNFHPTEAGDKTAAAAVADLDHSGVVVARQAANASAAPATTELRYFRKEDAASAQQMVGKLAARGVRAQLRDLSQAAGNRAVRPRSFDLVMGQNSN